MSTIQWIEPSAGVLGRVEDCVAQRMPKNIPPSEDVEAIKAAVRAECSGQIAAVRGAARNLFKRAQNQHAAGLQTAQSIQITLRAASEEIQGNLCDDANADLDTAVGDHQALQGDIQALVDLQSEVASDMLPQSFFDGEVQNIHTTVGSFIDQLAGEADGLGSQIESMRTAVGDCQRAQPPGPKPPPPPPPPPPATTSKKKGGAIGLLLLGGAALVAIYRAARGQGGVLPT